MEINVAYSRLKACPSLRAIVVQWPGQDYLIFEQLKTEVTPRVRHSERIFLREGSPECGMI